jgi:hypothetical protein
MTRSFLDQMAVTAVHARSHHSGLQNIIRAQKAWILICVKSQVISEPATKKAQRPFVLLTH